MSPAGDAPAPCWTKKQLSTGAWVKRCRKCAEREQAIKQSEQLERVDQEVVLKRGTRVSDSSEPSIV